MAGPEDRGPEDRAAEVLVERRGRVGIVTLNRPHARNALNTALLDRLEASLHDLSADDGIGAIVLTGNGPSFCAGADLKETAAGMAEADFWSQYARASRSMRVHTMLINAPKPVIAAVNGHAVAGGCGVAMACDLSLASDRAVFGYPEVARGLVAAIAMVSLSRIMARRKALDLLFTARTISAAEALDLGMVNRVVPHEQLMDETLEYAASIAANNAGALRITKHLWNQLAESDIDRAFEYARDVNQMVRYLDDAKQGAASFGAVTPGGHA